MKIVIRDHNGGVTDRLRAHVTRRLEFALGRYAQHITQVSVAFSSVNATEKRCQIDVRLCPRMLRAQDSDAGLFAAVDHATERIARSVARVLQRERELDLMVDGTRPLHGHDG